MTQRASTIRSTSSLTQRQVKMKPKEKQTLNNFWNNKNNPITEEQNNEHLFFCENENNPKLTNSLLSMGHLKIYVRMKYPSYESAGKLVDLSSVQVKQIVNGFNLPMNPEKIKQIASGWELDPIILTQLFERYRGKK